MIKQKVKITGEKIFEEKILPIIKGDKRDETKIVEEGEDLKEFEEIGR